MRSGDDQVCDVEHPRQPSAAAFLADSVYTVVVGAPIPAFCSHFGADLGCHLFSEANQNTVYLNIDIAIVSCSATCISQMFVHGLQVKKCRQTIACRM